MKHVKAITVTRPAKANIFDDIVGMVKEALSGLTDMIPTK